MTETFEMTIPICMDNICPTCGGTGKVNKKCVTTY